ncbi:MAG TPA: lipase maturation factor family protein [Acidobacteriota bacterium]|nr:lipase maturation factor family protein [Acidobacteriota bacterium]
MDTDRRPATYFVCQSVFIRVLAIIQLIAFASLTVQILGLVGSGGILPAGDLLTYVQQRVGAERYWLLPTLCWINVSNAFLLGLCVGGMVLSVLLLAGVFPSLMLFLLWAFYLSLAVVCQEFLGFQWDVLLLETGFLSILYAPPVRFMEQGYDTGRSRVFLWLLRWLLFRLMFSSGIVKLLSHDPTWRNLTALQYHYFTQPLPVWISWFMNLLPAWFQKFSVVMMFASELGAPFLIFCPKPFRMIGFWSIVGLQILIMLTGNYSFFNLLALALCLLLVEDNSWPERIRQRAVLASQRQQSRGAKQWPAWVIAPVAAILLCFSILQMTITLGWRNLPGPLVMILRRAEVFETVNRYGLFAVMTTKRSEIIVEGSDDGVHWLAYEFRYKPGDLARHPVFIEPHQPRLDWQMWFAALDTYRASPWFVAFLERLLQGAPAVLDLLSWNPFPKHPPRYIRARMFDYHFTDWKTKSETGNWWVRDHERPYFPALSLSGESPP